MHFAVDAGDAAIGVDDRSGVVIDTRGPALEKRSDYDGFCFLRNAAQRFGGGARYRFSQFEIGSVFALAEVLRAKKLRQADYLSAGARGFFDARGRVREILGRLGADGHLHQSNVEFERRGHDTKIYTKKRCKARRCERASFIRSQCFSFFDFSAF